MLLQKEAQAASPRWPDRVSDEWWPQISICFVFLRACISSQQTGQQILDTPVTCPLASYIIHELGHSYMNKLHTLMQKSEYKSPSITPPIRRIANMMIHDGPGCIDNVPIKAWGPKTRFPVYASIPLSNFKQHQVLYSLAWLWNRLCVTALIMKIRQPFTTWY